MMPGKFARNMNLINININLFIDMIIENSVLNNNSTQSQSDSSKAFKHITRHVISADQSCCYVARCMHFVRAAIDSWQYCDSTSK